MNKKNTRILITSIFLSLFLIGTLLMFITPLSVKSSYGLSQNTSDGKNISFNVFEPQGKEGVLKKAVIIGHGIMVNKEMLKGYAIELAAAGFVAVPFDFRGHGQSDGELLLADLIKDVQAIKDYLTARKDIDMNNLGYIGYSMGGFPGNEIIKSDPAFKCFIGIGTFLPVVEADAVKSNSGRELNILMILGKYDEAFKLEKLKQGMGVRLGVASTSVDVNMLYGSFQEKNASMLYLDDNSDHLTTAWDEDFIQTARDWVKNTFSDVRPADENFYVNIRAMILVMQVIGGIGFFFLIIEPFSKFILKNGEKREEEQYKIVLQNETIKSLSKSTLIYSFVFLAPSFAILIFIGLLLPLLLAGIMIAMLGGEAFGIMFLLNKKMKPIDKKAINLLLDPFKESKDKLMKKILIGVVLGALMFLILYLSFGLNYLGMVPAINKWAWMPIYFALIFFAFLMFSSLVNATIQPLVKDGLKEIFKAVGIGYLLIIVYFTAIIIVPCLIIGNFFMLLLLMIGAPMILLAYFVSAVLYQKTGSILPGTIVNTFFIIMIVCTMSPFMNLFTIMGQPSALQALLNIIA